MIKFMVPGRVFLDRERKLPNVLLMGTLPNMLILTGPWQNCFSKNSITIIGYLKIMHQAVTLNQTSISTLAEKWSNDLVSKSPWSQIKCWWYHCLLLCCRLWHCTYPSLCVNTLHSCVLNAILNLGSLKGLDHANIFYYKIIQTAATVSSKNALLRTKMTVVICVVVGFRSKVRIGKIVGESFFWATITDLINL